MGPASVIVGLLSFACAVLSIFLVAVPRAGVLLSVLALILSVASIVLGGIGMSQADAKRESNALPMTGLIIGVIAFFVSFLLAVTCGSCNACITMLDSHVDGGIDFTPPPPTPLDLDDGGKPPFPSAVDDAGKPTGAAPPSPVPGPAGAQPIAPSTQDAGPTPPPPAFPPPPMNRIEPPRGP
jgi:hypothetical protein